MERVSTSIISHTTKREKNALVRSVPDRTVVQMLMGTSRGTAMGLALTAAKRRAPRAAKAEGNMMIVVRREKRRGRYKESLEVDWGMLSSVVCFYTRPHRWSVTGSQT